MRHAVREALAATVLVVGAVSMLGGCASDSSADQPPSPSSSRATSRAPAEDNQAVQHTGSTPTPLPPSATTDRAPLGLEIRYSTRTVGS